MSVPLQRWKMISAATLFTALLSGCIATGGGYGYGYDGNIGIGQDYYEPVGGYYGGWGHGYHVGPPRGGYNDHDRHNYHGSPHSYRSPPPSHHMPSIPNRGGPSHSP